MAHGGRKRPFLGVLVAGGLSVLLGLLQPSAAALAVDEPAVVVAAAYAELGARYRLGAEGPTRFDCSGLVWFVFDESGLGDRIGGARMRAREYQAWFRHRGGLFTKQAELELGDLVFWGSPARHIGIVTRFRVNDRGRRFSYVTSALVGLGVQEVLLEKIDAGVPVSGFAHPGLVNVPDPTPTPPPTPSASPTSTPPPSLEPSPSPSAPLESPTPSSSIAP